MKMFKSKVKRQKEKVVSGRWSVGILFSALILLFTVHCSLFTARAQSGGTFLIEKNVIAGGGGSAAGGVFALDGTIGQSVAGTSSSGGVFSVDSGFWTALA
ncbi:MAG: hypothetical protein ACKVRN_01620, partial [Pyrinomonadaceae bacterium]